MASISVHKGLVRRCAFREVDWRTCTFLVLLDEGGNREMEAFILSLCFCH